MTRSAIALSVVAWLATACSGPPLYGWHRARLSEEFRAGSSVQSFADYLELEQRLFAELDRDVYAKNEVAGEGVAPFRYTPGSISDPREADPNWNRSFEWPTPSPRGAVLLLHGMSDSPYSLRALGEAARTAGFHVLGLRLPGHGTAPSGLKHVRARDMRAATRLGVAHLARAVGDRPIHLVGYSTGASLALDYALDAIEGDAAVTPASLVLVSPAIRVHPASGFAGVKTALANLPGLEHLAWWSVMPEFDPFNYNSFASNAGLVVHQLTRSVDSRVAALRQRERTLPPMLVFKSAVDATVTLEAVVDRLLGQLPPGGDELVLFDLNRFAYITPLMNDDPGPFTERLLSESGLPFALTAIRNRAADSRQAASWHKPALASEAGPPVPLDLAWPEGVASLSHVAVPFPPDDPLYGQGPPHGDRVFLGNLAIRGERGLLRIPESWLLRMRFNPFYEVLEGRFLAWLDAPGT